MTYPTLEFSDSLSATIECEWGSLTSSLTDERQRVRVERVVSGQFFLSNSRDGGADAPLQLLKDLQVRRHR